MRVDQDGPLGFNRGVPRFYRLGIGSRSGRRGKRRNKQGDLDPSLLMALRHKRVRSKHLRIAQRRQVKRQMRCREHAG